MRKPKSLLAYTLTTAEPNEHELDRSSSNPNARSIVEPPRGLYAAHSTANRAHVPRNSTRSNGHAPQRRLYQRHR